jgi:hypothetical protein
MAAGPLLMTGVGLELAFSDWAKTGSGFALTMLAAVAGTVCMAVAVRGLRRVYAPGAPRPRRIGLALMLAGALLHVAFIAIHAATGAITGTPLEASFLLFALGFLCLFVGGAMTAASLRRHDRSMAAAVGVGALCGLLAILVDVDPWHDVALLASYASWVAVGALLLKGSALPQSSRRSNSALTPGTSRSTSSARSA